MRTTKWTFPGCAVCAALLSGIVACSDKLPADGGDPYDGPVTSYYMSANILTGDDTYAAGQANENTVRSVRFYFFTANGDAANVKIAPQDSFINYLDWTNPETSDPAAPGDDVTNIEKKVNASLIINTREGDELPSQIVAIVNPPTNLPAIGSMTALDNITGDYSVSSKEAYFVMSNSVYVDGEGHERKAVSVAGHLFNTQELALQDPVTVHVERVNAKATLHSKLTPVSLGPAVTEGATGKICYDTGVNVDNAADAGLAKGRIYVEFLGWDATQATGKSYLMKHIDKGWTDADVFGASTLTEWNIPERYRSFWAINPNLADPKAEGSDDYVFKSFNAHKDAVQDFTGETYLYLQENAAADASRGCAYPTQLIIAAQLVDEKGAALTLAEYGFFHYTRDGLMKEMAKKANIYKKDPTATEGTKFVRIEDSDLVLLSATEAGQAGPTQDGRYYVYAAIKGSGPGGEAVHSTKITDYYTSDEAGAAPASYQDINARLAEDCGQAKLWDQGYTYFYLDIRHLGSIKAATETEPAVPSNGAYGVVRNHIYAVDIRSLTGLGTPVYRPDEVLYPEKPHDDGTRIGAEVKILPWRLVNEDVSFAW